MSTYSASTPPNSVTTAESENASCTTHITLPCELDRGTQTGPSSEMEDQLSLDASLASSCSTAMPECSSTQYNTPTEATNQKCAAPGGLPLLHRVSSANPCDVHLPTIYKRAAEDEDARAAIAVNAKHVFHELVGFDVDAIVDLLYVRETWFSTEVLIHALCLANRISYRYPRWLTHLYDIDSDASSGYADSPLREGSAGAARSLPRICSSTSSDYSHNDALDGAADSVHSSATRTLARSGSGSTNSLGDVFTRSTSPRCAIALLLLSSKFHGDIVYNTDSLSKAVNKFRDEQIKEIAAAPVSATGERRKPLLRMLPATLGQCEKRLFNELSCTVFVHKEEYQFCEALVLKGIFDELTQ